MCEVEDCRDGLGEYLEKNEYLLDFVIKKNTLQPIQIHRIFHLQASATPASIDLL